MAMTVNQDALCRRRRCVRRWKRQGATSAAQLCGEPVVREVRRLRDPRRLWARQQLRPFIGESEQAAWLQSQDRHTGRKPSCQGWGLRLDQLARLGEESLAD